MHLLIKITMKYVFMYPKFGGPSQIIFYFRSYQLFMIRCPAEKEINRLFYAKYHKGVPAIIFVYYAIGTYIIMYKLNTSKM